MTRRSTNTADRVLRLLWRGRHGAIMDGRQDNHTDCVEAKESWQDMLG